MFTISTHAMQRALDMEITGEEIRETMLNPRFTGRTTNGRWLYTRGKVSLVVADTSPPTIVTVLWATAAAWENDHERIGSRDGRDAEHMDRLRRARKAQRRKTRGR